MLHQMFRLDQRGRTPEEGRRSRRRQEHANVKAFLLKRPCGCVGPTGVARPDVLVQCDEGREAILGDQREYRAEVRQPRCIVYVIICVIFEAHAGRVNERIESVRVFVFDGLRGGEETNFCTGEVL